MPSIKDVVVDARNGKVLQARERVADGTGNSAWDGSSLTIPTTHSGSTYSMTDPSHPTIKLPERRRPTPRSPGPTTSGATASRPTARPTASTRCTSRTSRTTCSRPGTAATAWTAPAAAGRSAIGLDDENAYYDGTQVQIGHNTQSTSGSPVLDVLGHEHGHGVDDHTPGGISGNGTQEFVADTFGAATEWYANNPIDTPDFTVGERVNLVGSGPIRYMYNPSLAGDDNCYSSSIPNEEVHAAAGPGNHWFYLLAEGTSPTNGQPTSPTCNSSSVTGVGIQKAEQIMYNAMLMKTSIVVVPEVPHLDADRGEEPGRHLRPRSTPPRPRGTPCRCRPSPVTRPARRGGTNTVTVNNPGNQTGTVGTAKSLQMTGTDSASGQTLTWSATGLPAGLSINASTGLISGTPTTAGTYSSTVTATDTTGATGSTSFTWTIGGGGGGCASPGQKLGNPGFETGNGAPWTASAGVDRQLGRRAGPLRQLEGLAGRLRDHPHRHAHAVGDDPGGLRGDADVLPPHRHRGDHDARRRTTS